MDRLPLLLRLMRRRARNGPPPRYDVRRELALTVPGADGSALLTDHYAPVTDKPCPTVMLRAPYIRSGFPWDWLYGVLFAEQGFHVLMQSSRGTGGSGGAFDAWRNEGPDGRATVAWIREQDWFTGELYTLGPSYTAYTQAALATTDPPPEWRGAVMQVGHTDPHDFFWAGGAFGLERALVGGLALFGQTSLTMGALLRGIVRLRLGLRKATHDLPLLDAYPPAFGGRRPAFEEWLTHPEPEWWRATAVADPPVPTSLCTGWWDLVPGQVIDHYTRLRDAGRDVDLLIGPWTHTSALEQGWHEVFAQALRRLRGEPSPYAVRVHVGGRDEWRDLPAWPPPGLTEERQKMIVEEARFRYDPADPTPSIGGALQSTTQGQVDNAELEKRADVLVFTGEPLAEELTMMGPVRCELDASTTAASGDLFARVCDVDPAGRSVNVCDGLSRISADGPTLVDLGHTAHAWRPGHRLRLLVAGGAHPRYLRNYGTGEPPATATRMVATETTLRAGTLIFYTERR
ncbi:hydrolase [Paractinoplanes deccanensis]|uniref:Hydrolase n=1 Tax=Paractinoplanes deccanensis TaxID=113561 RepID=A0ABQ3XUW3_9ACTN|nr:CocE/NonD family hydrolase [Actinoplanes deccanensis]GID71528.1 hydrolase [Actinoplanes deccanensis]